MLALVQRGVAFICRPVSKKNICWFLLIALGYLLVSTLDSSANISFDKVFLKTPDSNKEIENQSNISQVADIGLVHVKNGLKGAKNQIVRTFDSQHNLDARQFAHREPHPNFEDQNNFLFGNRDEDGKVQFNVAFDPLFLVGTNNSAYEQLRDNFLPKNSNLVAEVRETIATFDNDKNGNLFPKKANGNNFKSDNAENANSLQGDKKIRDKAKPRTKQNQKQKDAVARISNYLQKVSASNFFEFQEPPLPTQTKGVVLFTNYRSGSTFLGELFNQHPDTFYIFEPLHPFSGTCGENQRLKIQQLHRYLKCDFPHMPDVYQSEDFQTKMTSVDMQCLYNNFCFRFKTRELCHRSMCYSPTNICKRCGPVPLQRAMNSCRAKKMSVVKIIRMCDIMDIKDIAFDQDIDTKIIHLIRDPRGIESSRVKINKQWKIQYDAKATCDRLLTNAIKGNAVHKETSWLANRYLRIRYEDLSLDPHGVAQKIYDFVGLKMIPSIEIWIKQNTIAPARRHSPYSTRRDSSEAMQAWRKHLTFDQVEFIQGVCSKTMAYFGYKNASNEEELLNFDISLLR